MDIWADTASRGRFMATQLPAHLAPSKCVQELLGCSRSYFLSRIVSTIGNKKDIVSTPLKRSQNDVSYHGIGYVADLSKNDAVGVVGNTQCTYQYHIHRLKKRRSVQTSLRSLISFIQRFYFNVLAKIIENHIWGLTFLAYSKCDICNDCVALCPLL